MNRVPISKSPSEHRPAQSFNSARLDLARQRRGLTKSELAQRAGIDRRSLTGYETGAHLPSFATVEELSKVLQFPPDFFFGTDLELPSTDAISFRSLSKMTAAQRDMARSQGALALHLSDWIDERFQIPRPDLPDLSQEPDPDAAAMALRTYWGWGEQPIRNVVHLLESRGVRVYTLAVASDSVDAFSFWRGNVPFIFLNTRKSAEHSRFDAAHELGHLVLHRHAFSRSRAFEREANAFASAFLMPSATIIAQAPAFVTLTTLVKWKRYWGVSVAALNYRLHTLGITSDWQYRELCIEIARAGYRKTEPDSIRPDTSQTLTKVLAALREQGIGRGDLARALGIYEDELEQLIFGLTLTSMRGGRNESAPFTKHSPPELTVIKGTLP